MTPATVHWGQTVRAHRARRGLTQRRLAAEAGISVRALRDIENGRVRTPQPRSVSALAAAIGIDGAEFTRPPSAAGPAIAVLGPVGIGPGHADLGSPKLRCLLALLALQPETVVLREEIVDILWGGAPPASASALVNTYVKRLRDLLARRYLVRAGHGYRLDIEPALLDVHRFHDRDSRARRARDDGNVTLACELFGEALGCWRGPAAQDTNARLARHPAAIAMAGRRVSAALSYAELALTTGRPEQAATELRKITRDEPLHEGLHARLMLALAAIGDQAAALTVYTAFRARLADEFGVGPGAELTAAHLRVHNQDPPAAPLTARTRPRYRPASGPA
ncbi:BTAD domain-containing putative transcriptional regulator [Amycolatopsis pigmentata]|uniref:BTAD domain-containing putative transcriptional regulator n=1 Tax=Amycolatopsis pigmentata TaxID=450801 RepID=A0ABW5G2J7_9PSEU